MNKQTKWIIGGGLATTVTIVAGLAIAHEHKEHHERVEAGWSHHDDDHGTGKSGRHGRGHHMQTMTLDTLKMRLDERFTALDTDGDGFVSAEEFSAQAIARFMRVDADSDGTLSRDEIKEARKQQKAERKAKKAENGDT